MAGLSTADRVVALLEWGDVAEADAAIEGLDPEGPDGWRAGLWRGARALMEGRFQACEALATQTIGIGRDQPSARLAAVALGTLLLVALRREQQRPAEAEIVLRGLLDEHPSPPAGARAALAAVLGAMGRDGQAAQELARVLAAAPGAVPGAGPGTGALGVLFQLAEVICALDGPDAEDEQGDSGHAQLLFRRLVPHAQDFALEEGGAVLYGSVSLPLGRLAQAAGRWDEAVAHLERAAEAHTRVGAPLLLAHTHRHLAALLRLRGEPGDWERAVALLEVAAGVYRRLGVDRLAAETHLVLARSEDGVGRASDLGDGPLTFRRHDEGWLVGPAEGTTRLRDGRGLRDIARLLQAPGRELHVFDLLDGAEGARHPAEGRWWSTGFRAWPIPSTALDAITRAEYEGRLAELGAELVEAERAGDRVAAALARAERDALTSALTEGEPGDPLEQASRVVATRIRISVDRIEQSLPLLGRHLRRSIRTGTFCAYEPTGPVRWSL